MSRSRSLNNLAGWLFAILAIACVSWTAYHAATVSSSHGEPWTSFSPNVRAHWAASARTAAGSAALVLIAVLVPLNFWGRRSSGARTLARFWSIGASIGLWALLGYRLNRFTFGVQWRTWDEIGTLRVPAAVLQTKIWLYNVGVTLACIALMFVLFVVLVRMLPLWTPRRLPGPISLGASLLLLLLLPVAFLSPTFGTTRPLTGDVIIISLDAARADRIGVYGNGRGLSPSIDRFAADAVRFDRAYCQEPWTLTSHMSMFTSLYPDVHGLDFGRGLAPATNTLAERLRASGYRTFGSVYDCYLLNPGFGYADGMTDYRVNGQHAEERARELAARVLADSRPTYAFLHFYDPHSDTHALPYESRADFRERFAPQQGALFDGWAGPGGASESLHEVNIGKREMSDEQRQAVRDLYDAGFAETDAAVGIFLDLLRESGRYDSALIVILADHGESLGESDHFMHEKLIEETLRIPLLIKFPDGTGAGTVREDLAETVDIAPTILQALGLSPEPISQGVDLGAGPSERGFAFHRSGLNYAVTTNDGWRILYQMDAASGVQPMALHRAGEEPGDGEDRMSTDAQVLDEWVAAIMDLHRANAALAARFTGAEVNMDTADEELLRSLGYIE